MKSLLAACALAALVITILGVQSDDRGAAPEVPAPANVARAAESPAAELAESLSDEATPVAARVEVNAGRAEPAPASASDETHAPARATATLTVRVVDEDGAGVHRANVVLQPTPDEVPAPRTPRSNGYRIVQGSTERDGRVTLQVSAGRPLELRARRLGESSEGIVLVDALAVGERAEATIVVKTRDDLVLDGRVVDAESGAGLAGIELRLEQEGGARFTRDRQPLTLPPASEPTLATDAAGRFRLPAKSWQSYTALCTGAGWSPRFARLHVAASPSPGVAAARGEAQETKLVVIELLRAARIEGTVIGAPAPAVANVSFKGYGLNPDDTMGDWSFSLSTRVYQREANVDARGAFTLEDIPANADLTLTLADATTNEVLLRDAQPFRIAPGGIHRATWTVGSGGRFECSVEHATGGPAPDEELWLLTLGQASPGPTADRWTPLQRTRTDDAGRCTFEDVQPGRWVVALAPEKGGGERASVRYAVVATIESPGAAVPVPFTLHSGQYITGTVFAPDGTPTPAYVRAGNATYHGDAQSSYVRGGQFRIGPLLPGRYQLSAQGRGSTSEGAVPLTDSDPVMAEAGAEGVELWLRVGCDFELSAIDSGTREPTAGRFTLLPHASESASYTGGFRATATLSGQAPGRYRVLASTEQGLVGSVELEAIAGERHVVSVPVALGGSVQVGYRGAAHGLTVRLEESGARVGLLHVPPGGSVTLRVPPGSYTLRTFVHGFDHTTESVVRLNEETRAVEVTAGGEVSIEIEH
jgi:hypothetical protein